MPVRSGKVSTGMAFCPALDRTHLHPTCRGARPSVNDCQVVLEPPATPTRGAKNPVCEPVKSGTPHLDRTGAVETICRRTEDLQSFHEDQEYPDNLSEVAIRNAGDDGEIGEDSGHAVLSHQAYLKHRRALGPWFQEQREPSDSEEDMELFIEEWCIKHLRLQYAAVFKLRHPQACGVPSTLLPASGGWRDDDEVSMVGDKDRVETFADAQENTRDPGLGCNQGAECASGPASAGTSSSCGGCKETASGQRGSHAQESTWRPPPGLSFSLYRIQQCVPLRFQERQTFSWYQLYGSHDLAWSCCCITVSALHFAGWASSIQFCRPSNLGVPEARLGAFPPGELFADLDLTGMPFVQIWGQQLQWLVQAPSLTEARLARQVLQERHRLLCAGWPGRLCWSVKAPCKRHAQLVVDGKLYCNPGDVTALQNMTVKELRQRLASLGYNAPKHMCKAQLQQPASPAKDLQNLTVPQLKDRLRARSLPLGGRKSELIARLSQLPSAELQTAMTGVLRSAILWSIGLVKSIGTALIPNNIDAAASLKGPIPEFEIKTSCNWKPKGEPKS
ncbi:hypothetical protein WJX73_009369 [Symbiochloris irregularis]|uniref:SAP domain-containing protein n=1 Tax=Symbiochloris irregularis TaxID=706552 RepID=A0AAW1PIS9_9CHLO